MNRRELSRNLTAAWQKVLATHFGRGRISYDQAADESGVPRDTLYKIASGEQMPRSLDHMALLDYLPDDAAQTIMGVIGLSTAPLEGTATGQEALDKMAQAVAAFAHALADNHINHLEHAQIEPLALAAEDAIKRWRNTDPRKCGVVPVRGPVNSRDKPA